MVFKQQPRMCKMSVWSNFKVISIRLLIALMMTSATALAVDLQSMDYSSLPGDKVQLILTFSEPVGKPNTFSTDDPARVVLDFANVHNQLGKKTQQINIGETKQVSTVEVGDRTRMVISLDRKVPYSVESDGHIIIVTIDGRGQKLVSHENDSNQVMGINFRRGEQGEARLIIGLSDDDTEIDVHQERDTIVVDLMGVTLPESLHRRLDVIDFSTPVQIIDSVQVGNDTRITLMTEGKFEHLAYQSDKTLVIEVKPSVERTAAEKRNKFGYQGEKLSLNFQNIEVRAVLQLLADFTGNNLVTSDTVQGSLTLRLKNVPWDQALDIILKSKGLGMRQNGNIMSIAPMVEISAREKQELEAQKQLIELEPLYTEMIEINFAKASDMANLISNDEGIEGDGFLSRRGSVSVDERTNSLLLLDTSDKIAQIRKLIEDLDIPVRQVLIESRIVIANNDFTKELGVRFGVSGNNRSADDRATTTGTLEGTTDILNGDPLSLLDSLNVNLPVLNPAGTVALALAKLPFGGLLELELTAMQQEGKGEIISSPRVITANQQTATIQQGTEIPYQQATSSGATSVQFKEAVLSLDVTPQITPDDRIVMDLEVHKDEVGEVFLGVPSIDTRSVKTQVLVDNGETVVLGGIYEQSTRDGVTKVPFFGDLPVVGWLFKNTSVEDQKRELLIFITPKIIKDDLKF